MKINRRAALGLFGSGAISTSSLAEPSASYDGEVQFLHGVASGDPRRDGMIVWTRVSPAQPTESDIDVSLEVAADPGFRTIVHRADQLKARSTRDFTVKYDLAGKGPRAGKDYWFRFKAGKTRTVSPVGRTRTLPESSVDSVVLALASCSLYPNGYFNAYGAIAALDRVDAIIHLGDYIYEYGAGPQDYGMDSAVAQTRRHDPPTELLTLSDYRRRHAQYKTDPQLQAAHARAPWIVEWDDHETANDSWMEGAENHNPEKGEGTWAERKAVALRAYYEWMPIREPEQGKGLAAAWRTFRFGTLASLIMVETRLTGRTQQLTYARDLVDKDGSPDFASFRKAWSAPDRRMICAEQERWLKNELRASVRDGCAWEVLGNQVVLARVLAPDLEATMGKEAFAAKLANASAAGRAGIKRMMRVAANRLPYNLDSWDGYPAARDRLLALFKSEKARPIVLAGDSHSFWVNQVFETDAASGPVIAAELGATSITSPGAGDFLPDLPLNEAFDKTNPEVMFTDQSAKGFVKLTLTRTEARADLVAVSTIIDRTFKTRVLKSFKIKPQPGGGIASIKEA
jgi:alkaline phosphatase D